MEKCSGITKSGTKRKKSPQKGGSYCTIHEASGKSSDSISSTEIPVTIDDAVLNILLATDPQSLDSICRASKQFAVQSTSKSCIKLAGITQNCQIHWKGRNLRR